MTEVMIVLKFRDRDKNRYLRRMCVAREGGAQIVTIHEPNDLAAPIRLAYGGELPDISNDQFYQLIRNQEEAALRVMAAQQRRTLHQRPQRSA